jgi:Na+/H+-dicarboxylate symporter
MVPVSLLLGLGIAIMLPILAAKGKGWRGLWFGLSIAAFVISWMTGSSPSLVPKTTDPIEKSVDEAVDVASVALPVGCFLGCLIAGCVYRKPKGEQ